MARGIGRGAHNGDDDGKKGAEAVATHIRGEESQAATTMVARGSEPSNGSGLRERDGEVTRGEESHD